MIFMAAKIQNSCERIWINIVRILHYDVFLFIGVGDRGDDKELSGHRFLLLLLRKILFIDHIKNYRYDILRIARDRPVIRVCDGDVCSNIFIYLLTNQKQYRACRCGYCWRGLHCRSDVFALFDAYIRGVSILCSRQYQRCRRYAGRFPQTDSRCR